MQNALINFINAVSTQIVFAYHFENNNKAFHASGVTVPFDSNWMRLNLPVLLGFFFLPAVGNPIEGRTLLDVRPGFHQRHFFAYGRIEYQQL